MKQKINRPDTRHGLLDLPMANLKKHRGMKEGGMAGSKPTASEMWKMRKEVEERDMREKEKRARTTRDTMGELVPDSEDTERKAKNARLNRLEAEREGQRYAKGGNVKKVKKLDPAQKKAVMQAIMMAKQQGGGAPPPPGAAPQGPPQAPPQAPAPGMKKGGKAHCFADGGKIEKAEKESKAFDKKEGKKGEKAEKWTPPWAKKKFAAGGSVVCAAGGRIGGKGDGIISRGKTKGRMV